VQLLCPRCRQALATRRTAEESLRCGSCQRTYPTLAGIPVLLEQPEERIEIWAKKLATFSAEIDEALRQLAVDLIDEQLTPRTREKLRLVADSLPQHRDLVLSLFAQAGIQPSQERFSADDYRESILSYYTTIHRDWGWVPEVDEVNPSLQAIVEVLPPDFDLGTTLVLGAGTARLCWDLAERLHHAKAVYALDVNPLPFLVTQRLMSGAPVKLFELPGHPRRSTFAARARVLKANGEPPKGLQLLFADGLAPPFAPGTIDTVITPWFVDQVPSDAAPLIDVIRDLLREGGAWINHGPFVYDSARTKPAHRYAGDEFIQLAKRAHFDVSRATYEPMQHLGSPLSSHSRTEWVLTMHATKAAARDRVPDPEWLQPGRSDSAVVPMLPGLVDLEAPHPMIAATAKLIDGERSVAQIAALLVESGEIADANDATAVVRGCLRVLHEQLHNRD
jgi:uncharacterized protein YbaR (Trm112 family)